MSKLTIEVDGEIWDYLMNPSNKFSTRADEAKRLILAAIRAEKAERAKARKVRK